MTAYKRMSDRDDRTHKQTGATKTVLPSCFTNDKYDWKEKNKDLSEQQQRIERET